MLVLTRKKDETIQIGDDIVVKVISCGRGKVKIGVDAPASVRVLRGELAEAMKASAIEQASAIAKGATTVTT